MLEGARIVKLEPRHAAIVPYIRQADIEEIRAGVGIDPALAVGFSIATSNPGWAVELHGEPVAVFGVRRAGRTGIPWLMATDVIEKHPVHFYRISKCIIEKLKERFDFLEKWVDERNRLSARWLSWAGFTAEEPESRGVLGLGFRRFWWRRKSLGSRDIFER